MDTNGQKKVSFLERCLQFRGVLVEGFHCTHFSERCRSTNLSWLAADVAPDVAVCCWGCDVEPCEK